MFIVNVVDTESGEIESEHKAKTMRVAEKLETALINRIDTEKFYVDIVDIHRDCMQWPNCDVFGCGEADHFTGNKD